MRIKNPEYKYLAENILKESDDFEFLAEGVEGETYYFIISNKIMIKNVTLLPGEYILKIALQYFNYDNLLYLAKLSEKDLIPKIYYYDDVYIIMEYIEGKTLKTYRDTYSKKIYDIFYNIGKKLRTWHDLGYWHTDLSSRNILIDKKENVYFIDPRYRKHIQSHDDKIELDFEILYETIDKFFSRDSEKLKEEVVKGYENKKKNPKKSNKIPNILSLRMRR